MLPMKFNSAREMQNKRECYQSIRVKNVIQFQVSQGIWFKVCPRFI